MTVVPVLLDTQRKMLLLLYELADNALKRSAGENGSLSVDVYMDIH